METKKEIGQRDQQLKVQVHRDDQSPHPGRLHGASLATAMQRPCRPLLAKLKDKDRQRPLECGAVGVRGPHGEAQPCRRGILEAVGVGGL